DDYVIQSFERGIAACDSGAFTWEITPVEFDAAKLRKLRPAFKDDGGSVCNTPKMGRSGNDVPGALLHNTIAQVMRERPLSVV
ncbi:hypothetical protein Tco_0035019, partial [Tanacetum coccineum]